MSTLQESSIAGPLIVLALCVAAASAAYRHRQYEEAKAYRFIKENECRPYKYDRKTGETTWICNEGLEFKK